MLFSPLLSLILAGLLTQAAAIPIRPDGGMGPATPPPGAPQGHPGPMPPHGAMQLPPGAMMPPSGIPPHVKPSTGSVSPEPGGSVLLVQPTQGDRLIPSCEHDYNPGDVLRLESVAIFLTLEKDRIRLSRKLTFSPTTAWKPVCDHKFFLGEPDTAWTTGARTQVWFSQPPRPRQELPTATHRPAPGTGGTPATDPFHLTGAHLTLSPFPGNPTDHRLVLELEQECVVFPEPNKDGLTSLNLPLNHLVRYTPSKTMQISVQLELGEPWHFLGATLPETGHLDGRVNWEVPGGPDTDLKFLISDEEPGETLPEPVAAPESTTDKIIRGLLLVTVLFVALGALLFGLRFRRKPRQ